MQDAADYKVVEKVLEKVKTGYDGQVCLQLMQHLEIPCC